MNTSRILLFILGILAAHCGCAQDTTKLASMKKIKQYPQKILAKTNQFEERLDKKTNKFLQQAQKSEIKMKKKLSKIDSLKAEAVFGDIKIRYQQLEQRLKKEAAQVQQYIPSLDTMSSSLRFFQQNSSFLSMDKATAERLKIASDKVKELENKFQKAEEIKRLIKEKQQYLKAQIGKLGFAKELKRFNKRAYYYSEQIKEYKALLKDKKGIEKKVIARLSKTKLFKEFMKKNGQLAGLFQTAGNIPSPENLASLTGLQARTEVQKLLQNQLGSSSLNSKIDSKGGMPNAQAQLNQLKQKVTRIGNTDSDIESLGFKPNSQKVKPFLKKFELAADIQSAKHNNLFPVTSDIGLSLGFKPSDKLITGIGLTYKLGWGSGFKNIRITHLGIGLRSFIDIKAKGQLFVSGGYEQNYFAIIRSIEQLRDINAWKSSALLGLSKKYKIGTKKNGEIKLLYDFFYARSAPRTQPLLFRVGFGL